jgi:hypothetical protein
VIVAVFVCATIIFIFVVLVIVVLIVGSELRVERFLIDHIEVFDNLVASSPQLLAVAIFRNRDDIRRIDLDDHKARVAATESAGILVATSMEAVRATNIGIVADSVARDRKSVV